MASVYLCSDLKHDRKVALKLLKPELAAVLGAERFVVEIKTTAALQHPHILPLFDSGTADGFLFYVMPYVEGETLRDKLNRETQLGVDEAVRIAREVADALDYAHRHGVIHRDIKPENILLHDGRPMVADFGIALAVSAAAGGRMTETGLSLGTPHYMSPEQATAEKEITARSDIYSIGSVLYEMLAGQPPHLGGSAQQIVMKIIAEPVAPVRQHRKSVPLNVAAAVAKSLEKLPADRFESAKAFADALGNPGYTSASFTGASAAGAVAGRGGVSRRTFAITAAVAALAIVAAAWPHLFPRAESARSAVRFPLAFDSNERITDGIGTPFAVSPDGRLVVYCATRGSTASKLYVRRVDELKARELASTDGAYQPAFSSDGQWIAYVAGNQIRKIAVDGGTSVLLATNLAVRGLAWIPGGDLVVGGLDGGLMLVPASGGTPRTVTTIRPDSGETGHRWPLVLPDGNTVIYTSFGGGALAGAHLGVATLRDGKSRTTSVPGTFPLGLLDGRILFVNPTGAVMATRYESRTMSINDSPVQVSEQVAVDPVATHARAAFSPTGTFVYQTGASASQLVSVDMGGASKPIIPEERAYSGPRFSPDGRKIAFSVATSAGTNIWIYDSGVGTVAKLTTTDATSNERPEWSADGKRVLFRSTRQGTALWWQPVDGSGPATVLEGRAGMTVNEGLMSPDGKLLLLRMTGGKFNQDIVYRALTGDSTLKAFVTSTFYEAAPRFSRDGRWVTYTTDESGARQVYVTPFPGPGPRYQVSVDGGEEPVWAPDGKRLYYVNGRQLIGVAVNLTSGFSVSDRQVLFEGNFVTTYVHANFDISPDGKRFLMLKAGGAAVQTTVVYDWLAELRARIAGKAVK